MNNKILSIMNQSIENKKKEDIVAEYYKEESSIKIKKELGQVFTPNNIVSEMLDEVGYVSGNILNKTIMENSFGDGAFLVLIVLRLIEECKKNELSKREIKEQLENNIYGIEVDNEYYNYTVNQLNELTNDLCDINDVKWNLYNCDALLWDKFNYFDFVIGNPPYVRIHNYPKEMRQALKAYDFSKGTTDLYVIFFEIGIKMLNPNGKLAYITPNSYLKNKSQGNFRQYLLENNLIETVINYGSLKVFNDADAYTCITIINKNKKDFNFNYFEVDKNYHKNKNIFKIDELKQGKVFDKSPWNLCSASDFALIKAIEKREKKLGMYANIQNGFATCRDSIYILKNPVLSQDEKYYIKDDSLIEVGICKKIVKASTYHGESNDFIIFPYEFNEMLNKNIAIKESTLKELYPFAYNYLLKNKEELLKRDMDTSALNWYEYARNQGLNNCNKTKIVINTLVADNQDFIECYKLDADTYVYSGLFITSENEDILNFVYDIIKSKDCCRYVKIKGKDMSGGFKSFSSVMLKEFGISHFAVEIFEKNHRTIDEEFLKQIEESYKNSLITSPRSNKKVIPIHSYIAKVLFDALGEEYTIHALGFETGKEKEIIGKFNNKDVDICASKNDKVLAVIEIKFPCNSVQKNLTNYMENMMGETKNIKDAEIDCAQIIVYPAFTPCFKGKILEKVEENVDERILGRYFKLQQSNDKDTPDFVFMPLIDLGNYNYLIGLKGKVLDNSKMIKIINISYLNLEELKFENKEIKDFFTKSQSLRNFIEDYAYQIRTKDSA